MVPGTGYVDSLLLCGLVRNAGVAPGWSAVEPTADNLPVRIGLPCQIALLVYDEQMINGAFV